ncbi:hypothetical protein BBJ28_00003184 [Nothophytophthora sp. Chile5]|nr:hypothetical protein BBJ28_00003184 [Nothophytophthora sp. Chile5]
MLRRCRQGGVGQARRSLQPHRQQRVLWNRALDFVAWMGLSDANSGVDTAQRASPTSGNPAAFNDPTRTSKQQWYASLRPHPPKDAVFPEAQEGLPPDQAYHAKKAFTALSQQLKLASAPAQLLSMWEVVSQCRPFVVDTDGVRLAAANDRDGEGDEGAGALPMLQMLPADVFALRTTGRNVRSLFLGSPVAGSSAEHGDANERNVVVLNEAVVVANLVEVFNAMGDHSHAIAFFENYNRDRRVWLQERLVSADAVSPSPPLRAGKSGEDAGDLDREEPTAFERVTRLWAPARLAFIRSIVAMKRGGKLLRFAQDDERNLDLVGRSVNAMSLLLFACIKDKEGALARRAIDTTLWRHPAHVIPLHCYEQAIKANLYKKDRGERELEDALYLSRLMHEDAGYVLHPKLWSALFNTSLHLKRTDCAIEVFATLPRSRMEHYQTHFRRALRKACQLQHPEVVLAIVRQWLAFVDDASNGSELDQDPKPEMELLNFVLWGMLMSDHVASTLKEMLDIMEARQVRADGASLQRLVGVLLDDNEKQSTPKPREAIKRSLGFWEEHSALLHDMGFVIHLLLKQCLKRQWYDECELLVGEIAKRRLPRVPCNTLVEVMDVNEQRGHFAENAAMGKKLLARLDRSGFRSLNAHFFERYLRSLLHLGRFQEICEQHRKVGLASRFPNNEVIRAVLRDAEAGRK